jgi:hypothetical protein
MNDTIVYDKAKYHYGGDFPEDLPDEQAFVHTGMYLGWIIDSDLYSEFFQDESASRIEQFKDRKMKGSEVYEFWDGVLVSDMLSDEGNQFSQYYFDFDRGAFLQDYEELLAAKLPSIFHVENTWDNYLLLKAHIDVVFEHWKSHPPTDAAPDDKPSFWKRLFKGR